jgi:hypothetical protein
MADNLLLSENSYQQSAFSFQQKQKIASGAAPEPQAE